LGEADDLTDPAPPGESAGLASGAREPWDEPRAPAAPGSERPAGSIPPSRREPRLSYEAVVRLHCDGRRGIHTGFVRDISRGGMFLRLVDPEPPGKRMGFELFLPGWRSPARGVGEVAWQRPNYEGPGKPPGMALRFVALEAEAIARLARLLPEGEAPEVEVLPRRVPKMWRRKPGSRPAPAPATGPRQSPEAQLALELPDFTTGHAAPARPTPSAGGPAAADATSSASLEEALAEPMIFVPPPPFVGPPALQPAPTQTLSSPQRWHSAAAGIAGFAGLATLLVVGAARREPLPAPALPSVEASGPVTPAVPAKGEMAEPEPRLASAPPVAVQDEPAEPALTPPRPATLPPITRGAPAVAADSSWAAGARRVTGLRWEALPGGGTRVVVELDGALDGDRVRASRISGDSPRLVVRLLGVADGAPRTPWEPATAEVRRIRAGRHDGDAGGEVHLVLDLATADVRLAATAAVGSELRLDLVPGG
jgi:uncharacterized protein (TIGR02266 family)